MKKETKELITELKEQNQDFEFYPTTKEMVACIHAHINNEGRYYDIQKVLDIGCGTENFRKYIEQCHKEREQWKEMESKRIDGSIDYSIANAPNFIIRDYYVFEKSPILLQKLDKNTIVLGTDFNQNSLMDKNVDLIFCNPPYSEYEKWTNRIIRESSTKYIYLIIPERWKENENILKVIEDTKVKTKVIGSFDFNNAERQARAKVDIVFVDKTQVPTDSFFDIWFDEIFKMEDDKNAQKYDWDIEKEKEEKLKNELVQGEDKAERLVTLYNNESEKLYNHFLAISSLEADVLESINVKKEAVKKALKEKIQGLKTLYWKVVFDNLEEITKRLTSKTREGMLNRFKSLQSVDFTVQNIYSLVIWVIKNANEYYNMQMIEFFKKLSAPENVKPYKSNTRIGTDKWRFAEENNHYTLDYRIICDSYHFGSYSYFDKDSKMDKWEASKIVQDICTIANNLGFEVEEAIAPDFYGEKYVIMLRNGKVFCEYRAYKNGNTHFKFNKEFMKALNVEVSRLLGWINCPEDIEREFDDDMKQGATKYFKKAVQFGLTNSNIKLLGVN